ncbi:Sideroflexin [Temnothorax longispinosus]|uniref:Sideroflexin n=1 Tax=Temnothorax longispinosus TaxID=300112 RepID=A0A4S2JQJ8_9HYME|nr:Sideroflexin [Temnothorax longispinosus]
MTNERMDLDKPLWDQNTFVGRWKYFAWMTDFRTCVKSESELLAAKKLCEQYRIGKEPADTTREQIIYARKLYESAFHPDTGDLQNVFGRMSFQVPGGMAITGAMLQFYRTTQAVVFWQWVNQSFNALVNYTNRNANSPVTTNQLGVAYISATVAAMITAIGCKSYWEKRASLLMARYVPFAAVAAANCANIPLMRQNEIVNGVDLVDEDGRKLTKSKFAAVKGISQVVISRIVMCAPGMRIYPTAHNGKIGEIRVDAENQTTARADTNYDVWNFADVYGADGVCAISTNVLLQNDYLAALGAGKLRVTTKELRRQTADVFIF